ncbi:5-dehydro-2-deoxygluconokinase [Flavihumibacter sp. CACIAM 22H1]|uniref:5-dehydro-2-deoxygluconokinase n=1 Tax=Flavihumibacter sp. CACIAM 22H1 TaxID=1812911 RepID=UPI0007A8C12B|nr:5-dehydro-2-deoxygluconokinase [Flavihumibacter sp. CACIAM 22H1]KYP15476.1 MAG: carbohydrate kinase [Flavihumibacter sp. CACIAM 22H1]
MKKLDLLTIGRSSIDLYSQDIGADFIDIRGFNAFVGGSPLNIAVCAGRLGLKVALLTGVGEDKTGDFILNFLKKENIVTEYIPRIPGARTSAVILGIEPPDRFPLVFYRDNCADIQVSMDHVAAADIGQFSVVQVSGNAMSKEPSRSAIFYAVEQGYDKGVPVILDIDFRADQWSDIRSFGLMIRAILPKVRIAIGTEEEVLAATLQDISDVVIEHQQISAPKVKGNLENSVKQILAAGVKVLIVKKGAKGVTIYRAEQEPQDVPGYPVEVLNVLGAGDAFAGGFIYGFVQGWSIPKACRLGNACGALVVQRPGCANDMPRLAEVLQLMEERGGLTD